MSERLAIPLPGSAGPLPAATWQTTPADGPVIAHILAMVGVDLSAPDIDAALATARPVALTPGALAVADDTERARHDHEQRVLGGNRPG